MAVLLLGLVSAALSDSLARGWGDGILLLVLLRPLFHLNTIFDDIVHTPINSLMSSLNHHTLG